MYCLFGRDFYGLILRIEPKAMYILCKDSTSKPDPSLVLYAER